MLTWLGRVGLVWQLATLVLAGSLFLIWRDSDWPLLPFVLTLLLLPLGALWAVAPLIGFGCIVVAVALGVRGERPHLAGLLLAVSITSTAAWFAWTIPTVQERAATEAATPAAQHRLARARHAELSTFFATPRRVSAVLGTTLFFGDDVRVLVRQTEDDRDAFEAFGRQRLVGRMVTVDLPEATVFAADYCCRQTGQRFDWVPAIEVLLDGVPLADGGFRNAPAAAP